MRYQQGEGADGGWPETSRRARERSGPGAPAAALRARSAQGKALAAAAPPPVVASPPAGVPAPLPKPSRQPCLDENGSAARSHGTAAFSDAQGQASGSNSTTAYWREQQLLADAIGLARASRAPASDAGVAAPPRFVGTDPRIMPKPRKTPEEPGPTGTEHTAPKPRKVPGEPGSTGVAHTAPKPRKAPEGPDSTFIEQNTNGASEISPARPELTSKETVATSSKRNSPAAPHAPRLRRASVAISGISAAFDFQAMLAKELPEAEQEKVFTVCRGKKDVCEMRVGGMNVTLMKGAKFERSWQYTELSHWEFTTESPEKRHLVLVGKISKKTYKFKTRDAEEICRLMTTHAKAIKAQRGRDLATALSEFQTSAREGKMLGKFKTRQKLQTRIDKALVSDFAGTIEANTEIDVTECACLPDGKIRLRCTEGWFTFHSGKQFLVDKVEMTDPTTMGDSAVASAPTFQPQPLPTSKRRSGRRASIAVGVSGGLAAFQHQLQQGAAESVDVDQDNGEIGVQQLWPCKQTMYLLLPTTPLYCPTIDVLEIPLV